MTGPATPDKHKGMSEQPVDVLIVGAGASGAAFAWSLSDTRMNILCLDQGDWMATDRYPSAGMDWDARAHTDFAVSPNQRKRPEDYPVGARSPTPATFRAFILRISAFAPWTPSPTTGQSTTGAWSPTTNSMSA